MVLKIKYKKIKCMFIKTHISLKWLECEPAGLSSYNFSTFWYSCILAHRLTYPQTVHMSVLERYFSNVTSNLIK